LEPGATDIVVDGIALDKVDGFAVGDTLRVVGHTDSYKVVARGDTSETPTHEQGTKPGRRQELDVRPPLSAAATAGTSMYKVQQGEESGGVTLQQRLDAAASESEMFDQLHHSPRGSRTPRSLVKESEQDDDLNGLPHPSEFLEHMMEPRDRKHITHALMAPAGLDEGLPSLPLPIPPLDGEYLYVQKM
jgi:hypothetical protein